PPFFEDRLQHSPTILKSMKVAGAMNAGVLVAWHFHHFEIGLANTQDHLRLNIKAVTVNLKEIEGIFPKSIDTAEHIGQVNLEKLVSNRDEHLGTEPTQRRDILTTSTISETRSYSKVVVCEQRFNKSR